MFAGSTSLSLRRRVSGTSIVSSMIWSPRHSRVRVDSCGRARTTMETSNQILSLKVSVVSCRHTLCIKIYVVWSKMEVLLIILDFYMLTSVD